MARNMFLLAVAIAVIVTAAAAGSFRLLGGRQRTAAMEPGPVWVPVAEAPAVIAPEQAKMLAMFSYIRNVQMLVAALEKVKGSPDEDEKNLVLGTMGIVSAKHLGELPPSAIRLEVWAAYSDSELALHLAVFQPRYSQKEFQQLVTSAKTHADKAEVMWRKEDEWNEHHGVYLPSPDSR